MMLNSTFDTPNLQKINMNERMPKERRQAARKGRDRASLPGNRTATYPYWMRLGVFLERQDPKSGLSKENLEQRFLSRGAGRPDKTRVAPLPGIEEEKLSEERLKELVTNWASGHKIKYILDRETGKEEPHVLMHSLTPNLMSPGGGAAAVASYINVPDTKNLEPLKMSPVRRIAVRI